MQRRLKTLLPMLLLLSLQSCAGSLRYSAAPIEAWVVDAETGQPLEGVIVVAHWELESVSRIIPHQVNSAGALMVMEAVTDEKGRFYFPAWGPKWHLGSGELLDKDPELILYKNGYRFWRASNSQFTRPTKYSDVGKPSGTESKPTGSERISFWSGEMIKLEKFKGTLKEYASHLSNLHTSMRAILAEKEDCNWKNIPQLVLAVNKLEKQFNNLKYLNSLYSIERLPESKCGSPVEYFKGVKQ